MNDTSIFLWLLLMIIFFITLYVISRFILGKKTFTLEIITIPFGIFKFGKRDEPIKKLNPRKMQNHITDGHEIQSDNHMTDSEEDDSLEKNLEKNEGVFHKSSDFNGIIENVEGFTIFQENTDNLQPDENSIQVDNFLSEEVISEDNKKMDNEIAYTKEDINENIHKKTANIKEDSDEFFEGEYNDIVYWTATGKTYHTSKKCKTLSRSKAVFYGTVEESGRHQKCIRCK